MEETELIVQLSKINSILFGTKMFTIRKGHRSFAKTIRVTSENVSLSCIVNSYTHTTLMEVPFEILQYEGFKNFLEALTMLRTFYPDITPFSDITLLEFRLAI